MSAVIVSSIHRHTITVVKPDCIVSQLFVLSFHFFHLMSHSAEALHTNICKNSIVEQTYSSSPLQDSNEERESEIDRAYLTLEVSAGVKISVQSLRSVRGIHRSQNKDMKRVCQNPFYERSKFAL